MKKDRDSEGGLKKKSKKSKNKSPKQELDSQDEEVYVVENILDRRIVGNNIEYFIKWKDWPDTSNTWEPLENLGGCEDLLKRFEAEHGTGSGGSGKGSATSKTKQARRPDSEDDDSEYDCEPDTSIGDQNIEVDVLEEVPKGKRPKEIVGVVPIDRVLTYLVQWDTTGSEKDPKAEDFGLVNADMFKQLHPNVVIQFYEKHIIWKRDKRTMLEQAKGYINEQERVGTKVGEEMDTLDTNHKSGSSSPSSLNPDTDDEKLMDTM